MKSNKHRLGLAPLALALSLIIAAPATSGCAAVLPAIPTVVSVITDAIAILNIIDNAVQTYFATHPATPEKVKTAYASAYRKAMSSLNAANHALTGVEDLDQKQYDAAFAEFQLAYRELLDLLSKEGLMREGNQLRVSFDETVQLPEPAALTHRVD